MLAQSSMPCIHFCLLSLSSLTFLNSFSLLSFICSFFSLSSSFFLANSLFRSLSIPVPLFSCRPLFSSLLSHVIFLLSSFLLSHGFHLVIRQTPSLQVMLSHLYLRGGGNNPPTLAASCWVSILQSSLRSHFAQISFSVSWLKLSSKSSRS